MAKLSEIIATVRDLPRAGNGSFDDNSYSDRQLAFIINYYRAKLFNQDINKGKFLSQSYVQSLTKIRIVKTTLLNCSDPLINDCIYRTEEKIPKVVDTNGMNLLTYVGNFDGSKPFQRTSFQKVFLDKYAKYTGKNTKYFELDDYIYIINPPSGAFKYATITGVFENPIEAIEFKNKVCEVENNCNDPFDVEYPVPLHYVDTIYKMIADAEYKTARMFVADTVNDTEDANDRAKAQ